MTKNNNLKIDELLKLVNKFNKHNIEFVVIKTLSEVPKPLGDLDILIINNLKEAENSLKYLGYTYIPQKGDTDRKSYRKLVDNTPIMIDLHLDTTWGGIKYLDKYDVWNHRTEKTINKINITVPSPEYELLITAAHAMRENKITLFDVIHANQLTRENNFDMKFVEDITKQNNWLIQLQYFISVTNKLHYALLNFIYLKPKLPFHFSFYTSFKLKLQKVISDLIDYGLKCAIYDTKCYLPDLNKFIKRNAK